jgi:peptidoglycan/LPS O-acetylase OafA/YrhL
LVLLSHAGQFGLIPLIDNRLMPASHHAVILFFVISGFSVAYAADQVKQDTALFLASRFSRIFSVAIPAILVTLLIDLASAELLPQVEDVWQLKSWFAYLVFALSFSGELWFWSIHPFSNIPFWSLNYEVYYYVFFAALLLKSRVFQVISTAIVLCAIGPKIILLLPCWLCGVGVYQWLKLNPLVVSNAQSTPAIQTAIPWVAFAAIYIGLVGSGFAEWANSVTKPYHSFLSYSKDFISDTVLAVSFSGCLYFHWKLNAAKSHTDSLLWVTIRKLAPLTFAIYALHYPMLKFVAEAGNKSASVAINIGSTLFVFLFCAAIGLVLEPTRKYWQKGIIFLLEKTRN